MASIKQLQRSRKVEFFDHDFSGEGYEIILKRGYSFDPHFDNRVRIEDTVKEAADAVRRLAKPFAGPYDD